MGRVMAIASALFLFLTLSPSWSTGNGNVFFTNMDNCHSTSTGTTNAALQVMNE